MTNSALARMTPLAVWTSKMPHYKQIFRVIKEENSLTHANEVTQMMSFVYCATIKYLLDPKHLLEPDRAEKAFNQALKWSGHYQFGVMEQQGVSVKKCLE